MSPSTSYSPSSSSRSTAAAPACSSLTAKAAVKAQSSFNDLPASSSPLETTNYPDGPSGSSDYHSDNSHFDDPHSSSSLQSLSTPAPKCSSIPTSSSGKTNTKSTSCSSTRVLASPYALSANNLPSDILIEIARWLPAMDRVNSIRVCKGWFDVMRPFLWEVIGHRQWQNTHFPLYNTNNPSNKILLPYLGWIKEVKWVPIDSDMAGSTMETFLMIASSFHNLRSLTLSAATTRLPLVILTKLMDKKTFPHLERLNLDFSMLFRGEAVFPISQLYSRFEQLNELMLGGRWFALGTPSDLKLSPSRQAWKLVKLKVPRQSIGLLRMCPNLRQLELTSSLLGDQQSSIANVARCTHLQELRFSGGGFSVLDFCTVIPKLLVLTTLSVQIWDQDQFSDLEVLVDATTIAPSLRHLELDFLSAHRQPTDQVELAAPHQERIVRILNSRSRLQTFYLKGIAVRADTFFTSMDGDVATPRCPCRQVKELYLEIYKTHTVDTDPTASQEVWDLIYSQLRVLDSLQVLTLVCPGIHSTVERGFGVLGNMAKLTELSLMDPTRPPWSTASLEAIVTAAPRLKSLNLKPLDNTSHDLISGWLADHTKTDLRF
ncbi:hypothetical protein EC991_005929 [Linnemannia zychae]|nr:hypothetical protein EC991_005929 [Linnemannia zychae]